MFTRITVLKNNIREERQKKQLTQAQLADVVGVSRQTIISIEVSKYVPSVLLSLKLANALDIKVEALFLLEETDWS
ncbi:helix-turn-helix transcriptional regulator [Desertivirga xinjiangensis]|uniref:helix-turn-helix transcriptional regulator n=1 Tax=Desertivirga xinjiangensis TaxID=539206 RepID=UPI00210F20F2|nr:helix-turn-helix transcriptional regulator [Pedobacter xinjiangensis]